MIKMSNEKKQIQFRNTTKRTLDFGVIGIKEIMPNDTFFAEDCAYTQILERSGVIAKVDSYDKNEENMII